MPWPLSQDYNEVIQSPASCFTDPDLRQAEPHCNAIGLPMPCSGNFADVYELIGPGDKKWAVKCFTRQISGLHDRYTAISAYLKQVDLKFMVDFTYLDHGIRIKGAWYPILKMDWVEGFTLHEFVNQQADNPHVLGKLCRLWARLAHDLRRANLAHADLQHGNVLLVPAKDSGSLILRLVDYDGMWVPSLAQTTSGELGHAAYQHPQRLAQGTYNAQVDRFPILVIYTALRSLVVGGRYLWNKYDNGDNLLFRQSDLAATVQSPLFRDLIRLNDDEVRKLVQVLSVAANKPLEQTPSLEDLVGRSHSRSPSHRKYKRPVWGWVATGLLAAAIAVALFLVARHEPAVPTTRDERAVVDSKPPPQTKREPLQTRKEEQKPPQTPRIALPQTKKELPPTKKESSKRVDPPPPPPPPPPPIDPEVAKDVEEYRRHVLKGQEAVFVRKVISSRMSRWREAAVEGVPDAQFFLGKCYQDGIDLPRDNVKAIYWFGKAAEQGSALGENALGVCCDKPDASAEKKAEAVKWYRKAADQGLPIARMNLGRCYLFGGGVAKDEKEGFRWLGNAAEQGQVQAQNMLGECYEKGLGVGKDSGEAVKWYRKAADQGFALAQANLGSHYLDGTGVTKNETEAIKWLRLAASQGNPGAIDILQKLGKKNVDVTEPKRPAVDLLALVDLKKHPVVGEWRLAGTTLLSPKQQRFNKLQIPCWPSAEYDLRIMAVPAKDANHLGIGLVTPPAGQVLCSIDAWGAGDISGLDQIAGKRDRDNITTHKGRLLVPDKVNEVFCAVRKGAIIVTVNKTKIIDWKGDAIAFSLHEDWLVPDRKALFVVAIGAFQIRRIDFLPLADELAKREIRAKLQLEAALLKWEKGQPAEAKERLRALIREYPDTKAAVEARRNLDLARQN